MIDAHKPCEGGLAWYISNGTDDLLSTLLKVNEHNPSWAIWLFFKLMNLKQRREIAIFCAEQVLHIFKAKYPEDKRPRMAIEAAKKVLENDTPENRKSVDAAYAAAVDAAYDAADAAYAAAATVCAATVCAVADAADAAYADAAAYAAYADADADARKSLQEKIIHEAVRIMERDKLPEPTKPKDQD